MLLTTADTNTLSPADVDHLRALARSVLPVARGRLDAPLMIEACRQAAAETPAAFRRMLRSFLRDSGSRGSMVISGLPVDEDSLPCTPRASTSVQLTGTVPALLLMLAAVELGEPVAYLPEKGGALVQDVVPVEGKEDFQGNAGSVLLDFHNENAFHVHRPDYVMLLCLRADHERVAGLRTSCIREVMPFLGEEHVAALSAPEFVTSAPPSFGTGDRAAPAPVLTGSPEDPDMCVDLSATEPLTPRAGRALEELRRLFDQFAQTVLLRSGDLAIVDNRVAVHGRTAFRPRYDGADRWLQRTFVVTDFRRSRLQRPGDGHVIV
ncbi:TauD/TfdA family dioxygenase [Nonomuraea sp. NPDC050786]|uniref:TauD/TfdA family dioxygenase n=1 Tax=Nonomuraea sp. NPDC050786 TaxID=3154840 RepID=UPI0033EA33FA